ncbi:hypothetical protein BZL30_1163 [Mycobacterium kansasii]|uniref:Uncharacterized protein n=1 Tax=Mycobacterium kansasii TaxID=1768 RepID=A0A1V3XTG7_MYCKA|nr:hypothetical protein BZL30_1163 [Mycobacterium kansasii]
MSASSSLARADSEFGSSNPPADKWSITGRPNTAAPIITRVTAARMRRGAAVASIASRCSIKGLPVRFGGRTTPQMLRRAIATVNGEHRGFKDFAGQFDTKLRHTTNVAPGLGICTGIIQLFGSCQ